MSLKELLVKYPPPLARIERGWSAKDITGYRKAKQELGEWMLTRRNPYRPIPRRKIA